MPSVSGSAIDLLQISTDDSTSNYEELKSDIIQTVNYDDGRNLEDRTRGGDVVRRWEPLKPNPSIEFTFDVNTDLDGAWGVLMLDNKGSRAFNMKIGQRQTTGVAEIEGPRETYNTQTGIAQISVVLRPVGLAWINTRVT